jgi:hypothetical protein
MNPMKEAIDLYERLRKLGNLVALTLIVIAQFVVQGGVLFFTIWVSAFLGGRNLVESWSYRVARVKEGRPVNEGRWIFHDRHRIPAAREP